MRRNVKANSPIYKQIGENLKELRLKKEVTQQDVADYLEVDRSTYTYYELGKATMNYERMFKLAEYFSVDLNTLLCYNIKTKQKTKDIPCMPNDTVYVIDCVDKELNQYIIEKLTIYAVIVREDKILLTCNGSGYYQWTLNDDVFMNFEEAQQKLNALKANN